MIQIINRVFLATLFLFTFSLTAQDDGPPPPDGEPSFEEVAGEDGVVSYDEAQAVWGHEDDFDQVFNEIDADGSGDITQEEADAYEAMMMAEACGDGEYPVADPGPDGGCGDYADCNGNGAYDLGEPCFEGQPMDDEYYAGDGDDGGDHDGGPTFEDVDTNGDGVIDREEARAVFGYDDEGNEDPEFDTGYDGVDQNGDGVVDPAEFEAADDQGPDGPGDGDDGEHHEGDEPSFEEVAGEDGVATYDEAHAVYGEDPEFDNTFNAIDVDGNGEITSEEFYAWEAMQGDGDDGGDYQEYGDHTVENCIAMAEGRETYWIGEDEFATWDDPNVDCGYLLEEIGFMPPPGPPPYDELDGDGNGEVDMEEARAWFQANDPEHDDADFEQRFNEVDMNNDGVVDPSEHQAAVEAGPPPSDMHGDMPMDDMGDMGDTGDPCDPEMDYPVADPGPDGGCGDYADCNGNGAFDLGEPCFEGGTMDGFYCQICDLHFGTAEEMDQHAADMGHIDTDMDHEGDEDEDN
ncbi:MAG: hypothetical protein QGH89_03955 [Candidatus Marinimicrobia bacterium]|nr:hypothetical protein [Candidatus Neomarinimicrobiota bacterium]